MTVLMAVALIASIAGFLALLDRNAARAKAEREAERAERQVLLQRIQAPEAAVYEHATQHQPSDSEPFPMSDEQIAEQEERARVLEFIERHET